jgi:hypothetical protein
MLNSKELPWKIVPVLACFIIALALEALWLRVKNRVTARRSLALPLLLCALCVSARATTYYVDVTNGNNSWSGTYSNVMGGTNGPLLNFQNFRYGGYPSITLNPGDLVLCLPGVLDHSSDSISTTLDPGYSGTAGNPIVFSNYNGALFVISNSGANNNTINLTHCAWVNVFNINSTNAYRNPILQWSTNCIIAGCASGGTNPLGTLAAWTVQNSCQSNWIHNCYGASQPGNNNCEDGGTHGATFGTFNSTTDFTAWNVIESNQFTIGGHDCISVYGPSNVIQGNWTFSPPSYYFTGCTSPTVYWGGRCIEIGGYLGNNNIVQSNDVDYCGYVPDFPAAISVSDGKSNVIRFNRIAGACGQAVYFYGEKEGNDPCQGNVAYNNSAGYGGYAQTWIINTMVPTNISYPVWQTLMGFVGGNGTCLVNNLFYWNFSDNVTVFDSGYGGQPEIALWLNNMTNVNPLWANTNNDLLTFTAAPPLTPPDFHIPKESPAAGAGAFLAHVTSASGTVSSFTVDNPNYFFAGLVAAGVRTISGDTIQFQGATTTALITAIVGNTITISSAVAMTNGQGIATPPFYNAAPSVGAYDTNLVTLATGQAVPNVLWIGSNNPQSVVSGPGTP